jgi:hypothetical protein
MKACLILTIGMERKHQLRECVREEIYISDAQTTS